MTQGLRVYPLNFLSYRLDREDLEVVSNIVPLIENVNEWRLRKARLDILASLAFARCFDKESQFRGKKPSVYRYDTFFDFQHGNEKIKLATAECSDKIGNTGPSLAVMTYRFTLEKTKSSIFIPTVILIPYVHFLGYISRDELAKKLYGRGASISPNSKELKPLWDLKTLDQARIAGVYV